MLIAGCTTSTEVGQFNPNGGRGDPDADAGGPADPGAVDAAGAVPDGSTPGTPIAPGAALMRVRHVSEAVGALDFCLVSETKTVGPLFGSLGISTGVASFDNDGYLEVPAGSYEIRAINAGLPCTQPPVITTTAPVSIVAGTRSTLVVFGNYSMSRGKRGPQLALLRDDVTTDSLKRRVRFVHAAPAFPETLDLEWRLASGATTYAVALEGAPYGGVATTSQLGSVSADGYASIDNSSLVRARYRLRVEGISEFEPPNTMRTVLSDVTVGDAKNFTVFVFGEDPTAPNEFANHPPFAVCADDDTRVAKGSPHDPCTTGGNL